MDIGSPKDTNIKIKFILVIFYQLLVLFKEILEIKRSYILISLIESQITYTFCTTSETLLKIIKFNFR